MISWNRRQSSDGYYTVDAAVGPSPADERSAVRELWSLFRAEVVPLHQGISWNQVRCELWPDSGRIIVFPARRDAPERFELGSMQLAATAMRERVEANQSLSIASDSEFDGIVRTEEMRWVALCIDELESCNFEYSVQFCQYGEDVLAEWHPR